MSECTFAHSYFSTYPHDTSGRRGETTDSPARLF